MSRYRIRGVGSRTCWWRRLVSIWIRPILERLFLPPPPTPLPSLRPVILFSCSSAVCASCCSAAETGSVPPPHEVGQHGNQGAAARTGNCWCLGGATNKTGMCTRHLGPTALIRLRRCSSFHGADIEGQKAENEVLANLLKFFPGCMLCGVAGF